ncbi:3'-5' exoribonuclease [Clostridium sp. WLY-B-L2]|uniref:3'-5' exoribonuclease n=1 Tax=Clostridium aromativorans TaxID=2836848 RepID=A0ABS8N735_9CLOT|nr:exonuclease domain-containing protein [Clostridium aromativorans]MCC9295628.1 3'-5' exoribonuclease [Clostridium aromativorans]
MSFDFVAIDFETSNNKYTSACSIGIAAVKNNEICKKEYFLIHPPTLEFSRKNISINGITPEDVENSPLFPDIWNNISTYFKDNLMVAHNAAFDMSVLKNCLTLYKIPMPDFKYVCSIPISTRLCRGKKIGKSLEDRARYFDIDLGHHHNSLDDAITCANLVIECVKRSHRKSLESFCNTYTSVPVKNFKDLHPKIELFKKRSPIFHNKFNTVKISEIKPECDSIDTSNPFYNKTVVFTGDLENLNRRDAMQEVVNLGGILKSGVSKKTDYLVVGIQDKSLVDNSGMSSKEQKAAELKDQGYDIKTIYEDEFLDMSKYKTNRENIDISKKVLDLESLIVFNNLNDKIEKLKEWKLLSPSANDLKDIYYKKKSNIYNADILGYISKTTNPKCISQSYETIVLKVEDKIIKIAPAYLLEMQKKDFQQNQ